MLDKNPLASTMPSFNPAPSINPDPFGIFSSCLAVQRAWLNQPQKLAETLTSFGVQFSTLEQWQSLNCLHKTPDLVPVVEYDERFQHPMWEENPWFDTIKEVYLLYTRWLEDAIHDTPEVSDKDKRKAAFWVRQVLNAAAPSNFFWSNPKAIIRSIETNGRSLLDGRKNFLKDVARGTISMVREDAFVVGRDLAITPGSVVYRNELMELIQYSPTTSKVHAVPIVIVTPWINKFYILDLNPHKSLVKYLVDQGFTVFITSWKNPSSKMRETTMDDYMIHGALQAVEAARTICGVPQVHLVGYCIGGTIVSALMAWLNHPDQNQESPVAHWSLFASLVDFDEPGCIDVFIDEDTVQAVEQLMSEHGYLDGQHMALSFRMLRSNSLIWTYFVNQYLCGEPVKDFDVLFWNMDTTRMPERMHSCYLREFYLNNKLAKKDALTMAGRPLDLSRITQPLYAVGTEQDHIVPWQQSFKTCLLVESPARYVLATSGHILGIISPPIRPPKRRYWVSNIKPGISADRWLQTTDKVPGSWWTDWSKWLAEHCGEKHRPPVMGGHNHSMLEDAPGSYVLEK